MTAAAPPAADPRSACPGTASRIPSAVVWGLCHDLAGVQHRGRGQRRRAEAFEPHLHRLGGDPRTDRGGQRFAIGDAVGVGGEARVGAPARAGRARRTARRNRRIVGRGHHHPPVGGRERLVGGDAGEPRPHRPGHEPGGQVARPGGTPSSRSRSRTARCRPRTRPRPDRGSRSAARMPIAGPQRGALVDHRDARAHRLAVGLAGDAHDPAGGLHQRVISRLVAHRRATAVGADVAVDHARVDGPDRRVAEPEPVAQARAACSARPRRQRSASCSARPIPGSDRRSSPIERLLAFMARNIALSSSQNGGPHARVSSPRAGALDLDHICAQRAQQLGAKRAGDGARQVEPHAHRRGAGSRAIEGGGATTRRSTRDFK